MTCDYIKNKFDHNNYLLKNISGRILFNESLKNHTSFKIGGPCYVFIQPNCIKDILHAVKFAREFTLPYYIIGNGSKLLVRDGGFKGVIIKIGPLLNEITIKEKSLKVEAGTHLSEILSVTSCRNIGGYEFLAGIPGTIGGAIAMNAGTKKSSISSLVNNVKIMDEYGTIIILNNEECLFDYRDSIFHRKNYVILSADLKLKKANSSKIKETIKTRLLEREKKLPNEYPNAGSIFKNPLGFSAGKLIQDVGLKGKTIGGAKISDKHANFIENFNNASAEDVVRLVQLAQDKVKKEFNINLELELRIIP